MSFLKKIIPAALNFIPGVGPIAGTVANALLNKGGKGGNNIQDQIQSTLDQQRSRKLAGESLDLSRESAGIARDEFAADAPLRESFREGALNFGDTGNPFSKIGPGGGAGSQTFNADSIPPELLAGLPESFGGADGGLGQGGIGSVLQQQMGLGGGGISGGSIRPGTGSGH